MIGPAVDLPQRKTLPHMSPAWVQPGCLFFVTICCEHRGPNQLCESGIARALLDTVRFRHERGDWHTRLFLLMPDHLHALLAFPDDQDMRRAITEWKKYTARGQGVRWQRDFFDHRLRSNESLDETVDYIRMNPVRQGLVATPDEWPWVWEPN